MKPEEKAHLRALTPLTMFIDMEDDEAANVVVIKNWPTEITSEAILLNLFSIYLSLAVSQVVT